MSDRTQPVSVDPARELSGAALDSLARREIWSNRTGPGGHRYSTKELIHVLRYRRGCRHCSDRQRAALDRAIELMEGEERGA